MYSYYACANRLDARRLHTQSRVGYLGTQIILAYIVPVHDIIIWFIVVCRVHDAIRIIAIILYITLHSFCILNSQYYYYHHHHYYYYYYFVLLLLLFVIIYFVLNCYAPYVRITILCALQKQTYFHFVSIKLKNKI